MKGIAPGATAVVQLYHYDEIRTEAGEIHPAAQYEWLARSDASHAGTKGIQPRDFNDLRPPFQHRAMVWPHPGF